MKKALRFTSFLFCFILAHPGMGRETITVTVTGLGSTVEGARKNAIQKAVRKALGEVIDAETIAKNGELIKDEVLTYSDGFISKTLDISGPEKDADLGLFALTIQAEVIRSKVVKRLKEVNIKVVEIDGNSLFAQALSKMEKAQSGQQLLAKVLNEDLDPAKLIKCDLIHRDTSGKLVRGSFGPDAIKVLGDDEIELTTLWEICVDLDAYYKQALPRLSRAVNQISKRKVSSNLKRKMALSQYNRSGAKNYHSYPTMKPLFYGGKGLSCLTHDGNPDEYYASIDLGWLEAHGKTIDLYKEKNDSPWRVIPEEEFFVAFEVRSNPHRTESDFEIHVVDFQTYQNVFANSFSRVLPEMMLTAEAGDGQVIFQQPIPDPVYLTGNNENKALDRKKIMKHQRSLFSLKAEKVEDPQDSTAVALCKSFWDGTRGSALSFTIAPEFVTSADENQYWGSSSHMVSNSLVMEVKEKITMEEAKKITSLKMQPISRNPK